ncbi:hypothetical protein [Nostoc sp.]|uniref:hypothetical protein n=1 Tax=Nostoc sp. TaxID=1180 RepID=UPI002FF7C1B3
MTMKVETALLNNQSTLENFALVKEIDEQAAEIISGGSVTIRNRIERFVLYRLDGSTNTMRLEPGQEINLPVNSCNNGGRIDFDMYAGSSNFLLYKPYTLSDGQTYEFQSNPDTARCDDIDMYPVNGSSGC